MIDFVINDKNLLIIGDFLRKAARLMRNKTIGNSCRLDLDFASVENRLPEIVLGRILGDMGVNPPAYAPGEEVKALADILNQLPLKVTHKRESLAGCSHDIISFHNQESLTFLADIDVIFDDFDEYRSASHRSKREDKGHFKS